jgi:NAD(P)-dependent dehydrogenase (short-subunit alcohol dehydrogenase family)
VRVKVALVTGAGTGVGRAVALALAAEGYTVVASGRRDEHLKATASEAARRGGGLVEAVRTDVRDPDALDQLFHGIARDFGRLDLLFNNAGIGISGVPIDEIPYEEWRQVVDTNLTGVFLCAQRAFSLMKRQEPAGGRIINNGSVSAHSPRPNSAPYTASKHALTGLTKAIALDGRPFGIACGQIDIGNAATEMSEPMSAGVLQADGEIAVEPRMDVENVARAVTYMASLPLDANVLFMTVMATTMPFVGRG